jgi:hypothetical protein
MSIARPIQSHRGLVETCRQRAEELAISRLELDRLAGLTEGYSAKLLGSGKGRHPRRMWSFAFEAILGTLGLRILIIEDEAAAARTIARRQPVDRANQRFGNVCRISKKLLPPPQADSSPPALAIEPTPMVSHLRVIQGKRKSGKYG